jgi:hypothetical protein
MQVEHADYAQGFKDQMRIFMGEIREVPLI